jgi:hypothetical protein
MATLNSTTTAGKFHNLSPAMLADLKAAKDAFKVRGLTTAQGDAVAVMQTSARRSTPTP